MATEKRRATRRLLERSCWMRLVPDQLVRVSLINISHTGARLNLFDDIPLLKQFDLLMTPDGLVGRKAEVAWRTATAIGLRFVAKRGARAPAPAAEPNANAPGSKP